MQELKQPSKKPLVFYYAVILLVLMLLNMTLFPSVMGRPVENVTYDQFMSMTYDKDVGQVEIEGDEITFTDKDGQTVYRTTKTDDPDLTRRLYESGAVFQEIDVQPGMLTSLLVGWVLPLAPFLLCLAVSMFLLAKAVQTLPVGTAYPVWTGIGAVGTVLLGIFFLNEPVSFARLFFIATLIASVIGLKMV